MNKKQFLDEIKQKLRGLEESDVKKSIDYYDEMIDDYVENGKSEEEAVSSLGSVDDIATSILKEISLPKLVKAGIKAKRKLLWWEIALLVIGSPVWVPILLAVVLILLSIYIVIWSIVVALYSINLAFAAVGVSGIAGSVFLMVLGNLYQGLFYLGIGLVFSGIAILLFFAFNKISVYVIRFGNLIFRGIKSLFIRKRGLSNE